MEQTCITGIDSKGEAKKDSKIYSKCLDLLKNI